MGVLRSLLTGRRDPLIAAAQDSTTFSVDIDDATRQVFGLPSSEIGPYDPAPRVSRRQAMQVPAVKRCRDLVASSLGGLPLDLIGPDKRTVPWPVFAQPEVNKGRSVTLTFTIEDLLFEGVAWWRIVERQWNTYPKTVVRLNPRDVTVGRDHKVYYSKGGQHSGSVAEWVPDADLIRFDSPTDGLLIAGAKAIRTCLALSQGAARNADGSPPVEYFAPTDGVDPYETPEQLREELLEPWMAARRAGKTGFVPAAVALHSHGWSPEQLELTAQMQEAVLEIARLAGVDPEELGVSTTSRTYANQQDRRKNFLDFTQGQYRQAVEDRLSMGDVSPRGHAAKFALGGFLRSDDLTRMNVYEKGLAVGAITKPEIRELEDRPPLPTGGNDFPPVSPETPDLEEPVAASDTLPALTFDEAEQTALTFDAPVAQEMFSVDRETRTIRGLAVPYGQVSQDGRTFRFSKGSITFADPRRIKLLVAHDWSQAIGHATNLEDTDEGLVASFKVARGTEGDRALSMAEDGVWDGLSVGIGKGMKTRFANGVHDVLSAPLREISQTPCPAYDGARITEVAASHEEGTTMPEETPPTDTAVVPTAVTFTEDQLTAFMERFTPPTVVPAGHALEINEPAPYRFDGTRGEHEFSDDVFAVIRQNDSQALQRVQAFMAEAIDPMTFDVTPADVAAINPARQRPDMYVDRLVQSTPLWAALRKGSLSDNTPFVYPLFVAAADLVDDHQLMVEPDPGSFSVDSQTVTPAPLSGKVQIPREIVDAGGSPNVSRLIWREMERAYYEKLEGKVSTHLASLNPTAITLPAGAEDADLVDALESEYAALQFINGGFRFDYAPTHAGLYKRLAAASDTSGRKLLPIIGATNANGGARSRFAALDVAGVTHLPVPTLAGTDADGVRKSYLIASEDVHAWASPPRELRFEYQVRAVEIGIWGYHAEATTRLDGVRAINYNRLGA